MLSGDALADFRQHSWHQKPCIFRSAISVEQYMLSTEAICRLTTSELVESRLVDSTDYSLTFGPFELEPNDQDLLPERHLLMAHGLEQHFVEVDRLLRDNFQFLPRWQIDDVMVSVGNKSASCGPHFDKYDVFLLQFSGEKTWRLDNGGHAETDLRDDVDIRLLREFSETAQHLMRPGDVLYVPPGVGHWGTCNGDSVTLSVGIRNPTLPLSRNTKN